MNMNTIFSSAKILLPDVSDPEKWAVIACDQFTSEPDYWEKCEKLIGSSPSAYDFILPEAFLGTGKEAEKKEMILKAMQTVDTYPTYTVDGFIALERTLPDHTVRRGIIGKLDLEHYDYSLVSSSLIRATEKTVVSRIPPRVRIRSEATVELPHILVFTRPGCGFIKKAFLLKEGKSPDYDFELMMGGGHVRGYSLTGEAKTELEEWIVSYEKENTDILFAVGDGNHSLAAAKAFYEQLKTNLGPRALDHPARYALCELVDIADDSICFEPIYRIMTKCDPEDVLRKLSVICSADGEQKFKTITADSEQEMSFSDPCHPLTAGTIQSFIDEYIKENPGVKCDYIHGEENLLNLARNERTVGFLFDGIEKKELFKQIAENGTYPRKTFSMGEAKSKRYYYEMRSLIE